MWAQLECGLLLPEEFAQKFTEIVQTMTQQSVNMGSLLPSIHKAMVEPYPEVLTAIQCIRAEGLKTALITNNWWLEKGKTFCPVDKKYFDVVSSCETAYLNMSDMSLPYVTSKSPGFS